MDKVIMTDKFTSGLDKIYEKLLSVYKDKPITLLEIGVWDGGSMLLYEQLLPMAKIYGIDILERPECLKDSKVITRVLNQNDTEGLEKLALEAGGFDVIIDDGSHYTKETKNCFDTLWKYLKPGGAYFIEDWSVSIKEKTSSNIGYRDSVAGMDKLLVEIMSKKVELGLGDCIVVMKKNWMSYAIFYK